MVEKKVYIIVLNYNNFNDTIECINSLLKLSYANKNIVICDNGSTDGSFLRLVQWSADICGKDNYLKYHVLDKEVALNSNLSLQSGNCNLILIDNKSNLGYSAGNNIGLKFSVSMGDMFYAWILNNDTVVHEESLTHLVEKMDRNPSLGLCGSTLLYRHNPKRVQALGGFTYIPSLGVSRQIGNGMLWEPEKISPSLELNVEAKMFGVQGASLFVRREFLNIVGFLPEDYFLYCEEEDWAMKSRGKFFLGYASSSIVFHKEGQSTGSNSFSSGKSFVSEYFLARNRLLFTKKFFPYYLLTAFLGNGLIAIKRILKGQLKNSLLIILCSFDFLMEIACEGSSEYRSSLNKKDAFFLKPFCRVLFGRQP